MSINIDRRYFISVYAYNNNFQDQILGNEWTKYGNQNQIVFNKYPSRFQELCGLNTSVISLIDSSTYIQCNTPHTSNTGFYSVSCWFRISTSAFTSFFINNYRYIPFIEWTDGKGKKCSIYLLYHRTLDTGESITTRVQLGDFVMYGPFDWQFDKWTHFLYCRENNTDRIFVDGRKMFETVVNLSSVNDNTFKAIKIGNMYSSGQSGIYNYDLDDVNICNDFLYREDFDPPDRIIPWLFPIGKRIEKDKEVNNNVHIDSSAPNFYNAEKTRWDNILDDIPIDRPVYWKMKGYEDVKSRDKHDFNKFHAATSNFDYTDKFKIKYEVNDGEYVK